MPKDYVDRDCTAHSERYLDWMIQSWSNLVCQGLCKIWQDLINPEKENNKKIEYNEVTQTSNIVMVLARNSEAKANSIQKKSF